MRVILTPETITSKLENHEHASDLANTHEKYHILRIKEFIVPNGAMRITMSPGLKRSTASWLLLWQNSIGFLVGFRTISDNIIISGYPDHKRKLSQLEISNDQ